MMKKLKSKTEEQFLTKVIDSFKDVMTSANKRINFNNLGYLPRWAVLFGDLLICLLSALLTYFILQSLDFKTFLSNITRLGILLFTNLVFFYIFRTYSGLIRHSTFTDAIKIFLSSFFTFISLWVASGVITVFASKKLFVTPELIIYFSISFSILFLYRILVKQVFESFLNINSTGKPTRVLVFSSSPYAISIAAALKSQKFQRFEILGFIEEQSKNSKQKILDVPILYSTRRASVLLRKHNADALLLVDDELSKSKKFEIVDDCLENGFKVFRAPLVSEMKQDSFDFSRQIKNIQIEDLLAREPIVLDNVSIIKQLRQKSILVTGGAGSIGSEIVRQISKYDPKKLIIVDQAETPLHQLHLELKAKFPKLNFEVIIADVGNVARMDMIFSQYKPEVVYHAAAYKHVPLMENNPCEAISVNIEGSKNLADLSVRHGVRTFVMISTDKAVNPSNVMGASKRAAEMYVQSLHYHNKEQNRERTTNFITTRFGNVLGSNGSVVPLFKKQIEEGGPVTITHPDIIRYFMTIPEACNLVLEAGAMGKGGEIFIFDMGEAVKIIDLAKKMIRLAGFTPDEEIKIEITGLRPGEKLYEELLSDKATTLPTYNDKIMIAREVTKHYKQVDEAIKEVINYSKEGKKEHAISKMKQLIPEYKSMNSMYVELDVVKKLHKSVS
ncbi:polysaccharide biosynthesis protein [Sungkyunkwania multivorans]|uniref:Polysaccharide biosynthesis protein n=1 Tax=Sungkyunkwania multivorans TaxID=1173618 RepID=A0ABW3D231_9FLAO